MDSRVLMVLTSHGKLGTSDRPTGLWLEELTVPLEVFRAAGAGVDLASPGGGRPPIDPASAAPGPSDGLVPEGLDALLADTIPLAAVDPARYDAVFLVGGHGTMWDFPDHARLAAVVGHIGRSGVVAAVCHGAAGLLGATRSSGTPLVEGRKVTAFSDAEEREVGADALVPFSLEQRLAALGAHVDVGPPFGAHTQRDGRLVTGQNPASSAAAAALVVEALGETVR